MAFRPASIAITLLHAALVAGQSSQSVNLAGIISEAAGLASALGTPSPTSSISSSPTSSSSITPTSSSAASSSASPSSSTTTPSATSTSSAADPDSGGITPQARTIIIAVCVVGGLLLLALLLGLLLCCCIRRRRKHRKLHNQETTEVRRDDWERGSNSHHGYVGSHDDLNRAPRVPEVGQYDAAPLMSDTHDDPARIPTVHPAYRTHSWDGTNNVNAQNPFTPNPPITRKPVPHGQGSNVHPILAAGAGAAVGAAAMHHHNKRMEDQRASSSSRSYSGSYPSSTDPQFADNEHGRDFRDPNRPPTPFGLNAFDFSPAKRPSKGDIEPSIAAHDQGYVYAHNVDHPTEAQRRSLHERDMIAAEPPVPERSPKRSSFGARGSVINPDETPRPAFAHNRNDTDTSTESWQSAQHTHPQAQTHAPTQQPYWDDGNPFYPEPRRSEDNTFSNVPLVAPNAAWNENRNSNDSSSWRNHGPFKRYTADGSPRRSVGVDGKPRRLRFSDLSPEEYHYDYDGMHNVGQAL